MKGCRSTMRHGRPFGPFCGKPATHISFTGQPLCDEHAAELRAALGNPHTLCNVLAGRARTPTEIARLVRPLS